MENDMLKQSKNSNMAANECNTNVEDITCPALQEYITTQLNQMRFNHFLTDMILHCEEQEFDVHSSIMAASSGFFQELVNKTGHTSTIQLPNVKASAISSLLTYIYTGNLEPLHTVSDLRNILKAATWLQVNDFLVHVSALIPQLVTTDNYLDIWEVADEFENRAVVREIERYVTINYVQLCAQPLFLEFTPARMQCICQNTDFRNIATHIVLKSIISWVDYDKNIRRNFISSLLMYIHENFIDDVRDVEQRSQTTPRQKVNISMTCNTSPPRTTLSPPQRDTATSMEFKPAEIEVNINLIARSSETDTTQVITKSCLSSYQIHLEPDESTEEIETIVTASSAITRQRSLTLMSNEESQIWDSQTLLKDQFSQLAISEYLNKSPRTSEQSSHTLNLQNSEEDNNMSLDTSSLLPKFNSYINMTIPDSSMSSRENLLMHLESLKNVDSTATINTTSPQVLMSSDSLALSLNLEKFDKLSNEYDLVKYCRSTNSQNSFVQNNRERVPRLHLTAISNDNCHLRRFASRCKIIVNPRKDVSPRYGDCYSRTSTAASTPESLPWPCICPILQQSDISIVDAVTSAMSERSSFSPTESEAIMLFNQALTDKLNSIPERETNTSLQSMISVPIPVYHPMFYLNRNALEKSAFKPVTKNTRNPKTAREEMVSRDENKTKSSRPELKAPKRHHKTGVYYQQNRKNDTKIGQEFERGKVQPTKSNIASLQQPEQDNMSDDSYTSSRETLTGLYNFNQQLNLRYWSQNFDGSPLTEPVVVILGHQKHGPLLMLNFNLDSHAWRRSEEIETIFKKKNLELLRNGISVVYKNQVYIIGGEDRQGIPKPTVLIIQMREHFQPTLFSSLIVPRSGLGGTIFQDSIYVVGGITVGGKILNQAERFAFDSKEWKEIEPLPVYGWAMSLAELGKKLISVGGRKSGECMIGCYSYDPEANQWTHLLGMPKDFESPYALVTLYGNQVLAFRRSNLALQGSVAWLDPVHFAWNNLDISGTPAKRILTAVRHRHKVWILDQSGRLFVYDPLTHTWENAFGFQRSISKPLYAFIVYRALPNQTE